MSRPKTQKSEMREQLRREKYDRDLTDDLLRETTPAHPIDSNLLATTNTVLREFSRALRAAELIKGEVGETPAIEVVVEDALFDLFSVKERAMLRLSLMRAAVRELDRWQTAVMRYVRLGQDLLTRAAQARAWEEEFRDYTLTLPDPQPHEREPAQHRTGPAAKSDPG